MTSLESTGNRAQAKGGPRHLKEQNQESSSKASADSEPRETKETHVKSPAHPDLQHGKPECLFHGVEV